MRGLLNCLAIIIRLILIQDIDLVFLTINPEEIQLEKLWDLQQNWQKYQNIVKNLILWLKSKMNIKAQLKHKTEQKNNDKSDTKKK